MPASTARTARTARTDRLLISLAAIVIALWALDHPAPIVADTPPHRQIRAVAEMSRWQAESAQRYANHSNASHWHLVADHARERAAHFGQIDQAWSQTDARRRGLATITLGQWAMVIAAGMVLWFVAGFVLLKRPPRVDHWFRPAWTWRSIGEQCGVMSLSGLSIGAALAVLT